VGVARHVEQSGSWVGVARHVEESGHSVITNTAPKSASRDCVKWRNTPVRAVGALPNSTRTQSLCVRQLVRKLLLLSTELLTHVPRVLEVPGSILDTEIG
jgi:transposase